jgi:hypothetical protein
MTAGKSCAQTVSFMSVPWDAVNCTPRPQLRLVRNGCSDGLAWTRFRAHIRMMEKTVALTVVVVIVAFAAIYAIAAMTDSKKPKRPPNAPGTPAGPLPKRDGF